MSKTCTHCKRDLLWAEFYFDSATDRFTSWCKRCRAEARRRYYENNKGEIVARARQRYIEKGRREKQLLRAKEPIKHSWSETKGNARRRNLEFSLPRALFDDLVTDNCFYCGAAPEPVNGIDRVDNARGYVEDNVVTACRWCNRAKDVRSRSEFEAWIQRAAGNLRRIHVLRAA